MKNIPAQKITVHKSGTVTVKSIMTQIEATEFIIPDFLLQYVVSSTKFSLAKSTYDQQDYELFKRLLKRTKSTSNSSTLLDDCQEAFKPFSISKRGEEKLDKTYPIRVALLKWMWQQLKQTVTQYISIKVKDSTYTAYTSPAQVLRDLNSDGIILSSRQSGSIKSILTRKQYK